MDESTGRLVIYGNSEFIDFYKPILEATKRDLEIITTQQPTKFIDQGKLNFEIAGEISLPVKRELTKIAFNFLAYKFESEFMLQDRFDDARNFIMGKNDSFGMTNIARETQTLEDSDCLMITCNNLENNVIMQLCFGTGVEGNCYYIKIAEDINAPQEIGYCFIRDKGIYEMRLL